MEIIWFFKYPRSTIYDVVAKYMALKQSNEGSNMCEEELLEKMHRENPCSRWKGSSTDFEWIQGNCYPFW